jgi:hypothetical protein
MLSAFQGVQHNALQMQQAQAQMADQARTRDKQLRMEQALTNVGPTASMPDIIKAIAGVDPLKAQEMARQYAKDNREAFSKVDAKDYTPESVAAFGRTQNFADLVPVRKMEMAPGGQLYNPYAGKPGDTFADPNKPFSLGPNGPVPNKPFQDFELSKATRSAPKTDVRVSMDQGSAEFIKALGEGRKNAQGAVQSISNAQDIRRLIDEGKVMTGPGSSAIVALSNYLPIPGKDSAEKVGNTRLMMQKFGQEVLANAHYLKPMSNTDIEIVKEIIGANPNLSPQTIKRGMELYEEGQRAKLRQHNADAKQYHSKTNGQGFSFEIPEPSPYQYRPIGVSQVAKPPAQMTDAEITQALRQSLGGR